MHKLPVPSELIHICDIVRSMCSPTSVNDLNSDPRVLAHPDQDVAAPHQTQSTRLSSSCRCFQTGASVLAVIMPLAAAAGTPMPGAHESPHLRSSSR